MIITALVVLILGLTVLLFYRMFQREREFEKKQEKLFNNYDRILHRARSKARGILSRATDQSIQLYKSADMTNEKIVEELDHILQESASKHMITLNSVSDAFLSEYKKALEQQMKSIFTVLSDAIEKKIQESLKEVDKEAQEYRAKQLQRVDEEVRTVFLNTYREILGNSITLTVHEELVRSALEKAKQEGVFATWQQH